MLSLVFLALAKLSTNVWTHILLAIHAVPYSVSFYARTGVFVALKQSSATYNRINQKFVIEWRNAASEVML